VEIRMANAAEEDLNLDVLLGGFAALDGG